MVLAVKGLCEYACTVSFTQSAEKTHHCLGLRRNRQRDEAPGEGQDLNAHGSPRMRHVEPFRFTEGLDVSTLDITARLAASFMSRCYFQLLSSMAMV